MSPIAPARADPETAGLEALRQEDLRVATIGFRLFSANRALCAEQGLLTGLVIHDARQYGPAVRDAARALFRLEEGPSIAAVVPASPAAQAGLMADDRIVKVGGIAAVTAPPGRDASYDGVAAATAQLDAAAATGTLALTVAREGVERQAVLRPVAACAARIQIVTRRGIGASKGGTLISLRWGLVQLARDDGELAFAVAHELAHIILADRERLDAEGVARGMFAGLGPNGAKLRDAEYAVDALALGLMARAGYDPAAALRFAERIGDATRTPITNGTHPRWGKRAEAMRPVIATIAARQAAGGELLPSDSPP